MIMDFDTSKTVKGIDLELNRNVISLRELCVHPKSNGLIKLSIFTPKKIFFELFIVEHNGKRPKGG